MDKKIRFNIDAREAQAFQDKMRESAKSMAVDIVNYARTQSSSAKETIQLIEEQIRLIEKRNRLDREVASGALAGRFATGEISRKQYGAGLADIESQSRQDNITTKLLRELIETTKQTSRDEIRVNRESARRTVRAGHSDDEMANLRRIYLEEGLGPEGSGSRGGGGMGAQMGAMVSPMMTGNLTGILGAASRFLGPAAILGLMTSVGLAIYKDYENASQSYAVANQIPLRDAILQAANRTNPNLGLRGIEIVQREATLMRSYGGALNESTEGLIGAGISRGISDQALSQLMGVTRFSGGSGISVISNLENFLEKAERPLIRLPELLESYLKKSDEILRSTGVLNAEGLQQTIASISKSYNVESYNLDRMMGVITGAAGPQSKNPILESIKLQTLKELYPEQSMWDRYGIMTHAAENPEYLQALMGNLRKFGTNVGRTGQGFALANMLGGGFDDINRILEGEFRVEQLPKDTSGKTRKERDEELADSYEKAAKEMVGSIRQLETTLSDIKDATAKIGVSVGDGLKKAAEYYEDTKTYRNRYQGYIGSDDLNPYSLRRRGD